MNIRAIKFLDRKTRDHYRAKRSLQFHTFNILNINKFIRIITFKQGSGIKVSLGGVSRLILMIMCAQTVTLTPPRKVSNLV